MRKKVGSMKKSTICARKEEVGVLLTFKYFI